MKDSLGAKVSQFFLQYNFTHKKQANFNPLNVKLNPICDLLALLGYHPILHINRIRVKDACKFHIPDFCAIFFARN